MRSPRKATIIFVVILLLFLISFVSAELDKRDPQAPGGPPPAGGDAAPPAGGPPAGGDAAPPAGGPPAGGKAAPPAGGPPAGGDAAPPAGGPPAGGDAAPPAGGPPAGGDAAPPAGGPPAGGDAAPPAGGKAAPPAAAPPAGGKVAPPAGTTPGGKAPATTPKKPVNPLTPSVQVQILQPKAAKNILYKIGTNITFIWKYSTDFADPPLSISVYAQPEVNLKNYYTIAQNISLNATQQEVTWVTANEPSLPMTKYKLWICDQRGLNAAPVPGGLQVFSGLSFGLYTPQTDNSCPSCSLNNAISISTIPLVSTVGFILITIISFNFILI